MKRTKHSVALALAVMLACQPVSAYALTFADMNLAPWPGAETSINKAADLNLVIGETKNGKNYFRPKDSVSLSESCQFAYKLLLQTGKASADSTVTQKWTPIMSAYSIPSWAYPAVAYCLENGILTSASNLGSFMKNGSGLPATREQAATILGRALTKAVSSYTASETTTSFKDNDSISSEARPYVALLKKVGVVNGDDNNNFNPKKTLNRTETAVLVTNLYTVLKNAGTTTDPVTPVNPTTSTQKGTISNMTKFYVNLKDSSAYYMPASSGVTVTLNGASSTIDAVTTLFKAGTTVEATLTLDNSLHFTKLEATYQETRKTKGELTNVKYYKADNSGYITIAKSNTYNIADGDDVKITIDKKSYTLKQLYTLFTESTDNKTTITVEITLDSKGNLATITGTTSSSSSDSLKGTLSKMNYDKSDKTGYVQLKNQTTKYYIDDTDDVTVKIDSKTATYKELYNLYDDGDNTITITLTLDSKDYVTKIIATTSDSSSSSDGNVATVTYNEKKDTGTVKIGSTTYTVDDVDDVTLSITDGDNDKITDWASFFNAYKDKKSMTVSATVKSDEVTKITGRVTQVSGELSKLGNNYIKLIGKYSDEKFSYLFDKDETDNIKATITGTNGINTLEDLIDWYESGDELNLVLTLDKNGEITKITGTYE